MLVLGRKEKESLVIGKDIKVTIVKVKGGRVTVGVEAPRTVPVVRAELLNSEEESKSN